MRPMSCIGTPPLHRMPPTCCTNASARCLPHRADSLTNPKPCCAPHPHTNTCQSDAEACHTSSPAEQLDNTACSAQVLPAQNGHIKQQCHAHWRPGGHHETWRNPELFGKKRAHTGPSKCHSNALCLRTCTITARTVMPKADVETDGGTIKAWRMPCYCAKFTDVAMRC